VDPYEPLPVPDRISPEVKAYLEDELARIALIINHLLQYNEDNP
jgi:hypothetical protein